MTRLFKLSILLVLIFSNACSIWQWKDFESEEGGFNIMMPGKPSLKVDTQRIDGPDVNIKTYYYESSPWFGIPGVTYAIAYTDMPLRNSKGEALDFDMQAGLDGARDGGVSSLKGTLLKEDNVTHFGNPGKYLEIDFSQGQMKTLFFFTPERRMFQLMFIHPKNKDFSQQWQGYLESFELWELEG